MTPSEAWRVFHPELRAVTVEMWSDDDYVDDPEKRQLAADVEAGTLTPGVLSEIEDCLTRDWCTGRIKTAALTILAAHDKLEVWSATTYYSRRPRTRVINGVRYIV